MATCAICTETAALAYNIAPGVSITYCKLHVPRALAKTPHLLSPVVEEPVVEAVAKSSKKKTEPVVEAVAEETPVDATDS